VEESRREFLLRTAIAGGAVWAAPAISTTTVARAGALSGRPGPIQDDPGTGATGDVNPTSGPEVLSHSESRGSLAFTGAEIAELAAAAGAATAAGVAAVRLGRRRSEPPTAEEAVESDDEQADGD